MVQLVNFYSDWIIEGARHHWGRAVRNVLRTTKRYGAERQLVLAMHPGIWSFMHVCHGNMHAHATCVHIHDVSKMCSYICAFVKWLHMRLCAIFLIGIVDSFSTTMV